MSFDLRSIGSVVESIQALGVCVLGDARSAVRALVRRPGLTLTAVVTLGIGVGSAVAVFGIVNQFLLRPPPGVTDSENVAFVEFGTSERRGVSISGPTVQALRESASLLRGLATFDYVGVQASIGDARPIEVRAYTIYGDYFELLGVVPAAGRLLTAQETGPEADPRRTIISERLWERLFARSPGAIGRTIEANGERFTVIGVAGNGFRGTNRTWSVDMWVPRSAYPLLTQIPADRFWSRKSRLNQEFVAGVIPAAGLAGAEEELNAILSGLPEGPAGHRPRLEDIRATFHPGLGAPAWLRPRLLPTLSVLGLAGLFILLIPCANVANLLVVRAVDSRDDIALRRALGASRNRIARHTFLQSLLLAAVCTGTGAAVAWLVGFTVRGVGLSGLPAFDGFVVDWRVLCFTAAVVLVTAVLSGTVPALLTARLAPQAGLVEAGNQVTARHGGLRRALSAVQIGLCLTLLVGSLLLVQTVRNAYQVDTGVAVEDVYATPIDLRRDHRMTEGELEVLHSELLAAAKRVRGVEGAVLHSFYGPYAGERSGRIALSLAAEAETRTVANHAVSPRWFELFGVEPISGRTFRQSDRGTEDPRPVVLTRGLARRLFGREDAVNRTVRIGTSALEEARVVGVVPNLRLGDLRSPAKDTYFVPFPPEQASPITIVTRTSSGRPRVARRLQGALERAALGLPVPRPEPLAGRIDAQLSEQRILARILGLFSVLAVAVAAVGLYGVVAFGVAQRKREFAVRLALGAGARRIGRLVLRSAATIVGLGTALGLVGAYVLGRMLESRLFGVHPVDSATYLGATAIMALVAGVACWLPARSAIRVDPVAHLNSD